ncbi:MAG: rod shape-determining protein [Eubacteriales bacterium]|nr:rod shape-determining protein [Eubacteriales bacterium]
MAALTKYPESLVFGLDIGTRSIVGTVGYREGKQFRIVAQCVKFHDTRAMLDGQIHDIGKVGEEIIYVKEELEKQLSGRKLKEVCIAAAGRVLKTAVGNSYYEFPETTPVNQEYIHSLEMLGVEKAHEQMQEENDTDVKFFCVGYSVIKYYLNGEEIGNLEGHKARTISADVLATFLPEEVVDGLYAAVSIADLEIANMTLEPIAAIQVAIPESYRMLNIALVDVGAGTSDICITKSGSVIGYGMLPNAGDEITECLVQRHLVDFATAEKIKMIAPGKKTLSYKDIIGITHKISPAEVYEQVDSVLEDITKKTAEKIKELNGGKTVSAVFVVGGGGKIKGYVEKLAKHLELPAERVALRGQEVLGFVDILVDGVKKDPLLVTPIGICLNFYEQKNHFIFLQVNGERVKLYNNDNLTVFDAAIAYGLSNDEIFPRRGNDLNYKLNGKAKFVRGVAGESAKILLNGTEVGMNHLIAAGDQIQITPSTAGDNATVVLGNLSDFGATIQFEVNERMISCPRYASVNGNLASEFYQIEENDNVEILNYYTLSQLMQFMDIETPHEVYVNGARAGADTKIYENFKVAWIEQEEIYKAQKMLEEKKQKEQDAEMELLVDNETQKQAESDRSKTDSINASDGDSILETSAETVENKEIQDMHVTVNGKSITLSGKSNYVFVDIFDKYEFDLTKVHGTILVQRIDGNDAEHFSPLHQGANIELYWDK